MARQKGKVTMEISFKKYINGKDVTLKGAFSQNNIIDYVIKIPREKAVRRVYLILNSDEFYEEIKSDCYEFIWEDLEEGMDIYSLSVNLSKYKPDIYFINICFESFKTTTYLYDKFDYRRQLTIYKENNETPDIPKGIMYHIFVDRFYSSGKSPVKKTSVLNPDWDNGTPQFSKKPGDPLKNNMVFGGDLYGIAEKMDYIASLGTEYIYLSPIFEAYSNHKYDTGNYMEADEGFGGQKALKILIDTASRYGIKVILDGVFNHTGDDSLYFNKYSNYKSEGAYNSKNSPYFKWYNFRNFPDDYEAWWGIEILPRVNSADSDYLKYICGKNGVVDKWMTMGISGWRIDVADELSDRFLNEFHRSVKSKNKNAIIIGEVWENASNKIAYNLRRKYFLGEQLDSVMNYPLRDAVISLIKDKNTDKLINTIKIISYQYPDKVKSRLMNLLSTHDTERIITVLAGKQLDNNDNLLLSQTFLTDSQYKKGIKAVKIAYALLYFMPGIPSVFYGDEIGMEGYHDPFCRRPFKWKNTEKNPLLNWFRKLGKIRKTHSAFHCEDLMIEYYDNQRFILSRSDKNEKIIFGCNLSDFPFHIKSDSLMTNLFEAKNKGKNLVINPNDFILIKINPKGLIEI